MSTESPIAESPAHETPESFRATTRTETAVSNPDIPPMSHQERGLEPNGPAETSRKTQETKKFQEDARNGLPIATSRDDSMNVVADSRSVILDDAAKSIIKEVAPMKTEEQTNIEKQLGMPGIGKELNETTTGIVSQVATGYYRFDTKTNGWVDPAGGMLMLWPENISAIERYLNKTNPNHPYLKRQTDRVNDAAGKYAFSDVYGMGHNTALMEVDYNNKFKQLQDAGKNSDEIMQEMSKNHAVEIGADSAMKSFTELYPQSYQGSEEFKTPYSAYGKDVIDKAIRSNRDMEKILDDVVTGLVKYDAESHSWSMVSKDKKNRVPLDFTQGELNALYLALLQTKEGRNQPFFSDANKPTGSLQGYDQEKINALRKDYYSPNRVV